LKKGKRREIKKKKSAKKPNGSPLKRVEECGGAPDAKTGSRGETKKV